MSLDGSELLFTNKGRVLVKYDIGGIQVSTIDAEGTRCLDKGSKLYVLLITDRSNDHRKIFFTDFASLQIGMRSLFEAQGLDLERRNMHYEVLESLPRSPLGERYLVKHKISGRKFELSEINQEGFEDPIVADQFW